MTILEEKLWLNELFFPAYLSVLSATSLISYGVLSTFANSLKARYDTGQDDAASDGPECSNTDNSDFNVHVEALGGPVIFTFKALRLLTCIILAGLTIVSLLLDIGSKDGYWLGEPTIFLLHKLDLSANGLAQVALLSTYLYAAILSFITLTCRKHWVSLVNGQLVTVLFLTWLLFAYRDIWPLATYSLQPPDLSEGWLLWTKLAVLSVAGVGIPLFIPRQYVPVDPKEPASEPNPEQTASLFSLVLYTFLDPIIFKAYSVSHLSADQFPPLADYDYAKNLVKRSFKHLDPFSGAKNRHPFFGLMRVFYKEYIGITLMSIIRVVTMYASPIGINRLLDYLESGGKGAVVRPFIWISWLFFGPVIGTLAMQWYIFLTTGTMVRCEGMLTELVFEHALRIRMKAQTQGGKTPTASSSTTAATTPDTASISESQIAAETSAASSVSGDETLRATSESTQGKGRKKDASSVASKLAGALKDTDSKGSSSSTDNLVGKLNNLVTSDLQNIVEGRDFMMLIVQSPLLVGFGIWFLYEVLGWSAFVGLGVMIISFPLPGYIAKLTQTVQVEKMKKADARVQTVTEMINVARMVKLFGWENKMREKCSEKREEELEWNKRRQFLDLANSCVNFVIPILTMLATFAVYTLVMKKTLTASRVYSSVAVFDMLRESLHLIFYMIPASIQAKVSLDRVAEFLNDTELLDEFQTVKDGTTITDDISGAPENKDTIGFCDASFLWSNDVEGFSTPSRRMFRLILEDEVVFRKGINLVIGPTGSGKTSLLMALLGEMHYLPSGPSSWVNLPRDKGVAYAAQESWVLNETIRDNILFGAAYDEERYNKVIRQCGLERDLTLFEAGDLTEVGEKGLTLSGGQKARVTLARAIYSSAEIVLLDDVLAALDVHTARWIVDECFQGDLVQERTVILVTHNVAMVSPLASYVVSIGKNGRIANRGSVAEVLGKDKEMQAEMKKSIEMNKKEEEVTMAAPEDKKPAKGDGKLVMAEEIAEGHVSWPALKLYLFNLGGVFFWVSFIFAIAFTDFANVFEIWFLGFWARQYTLRDPSDVSVPFYLGFVVLIMGSGVAAYTLGYISYVYGSLRASRVIHQRLIKAITGTTLRWLDSTPTGRIITRCTQDIRTVDGPVSQQLGWVIELTISLLMKMAAIVYMSPVFLVPGLIVGLLGGWFGQIYIKAQLSVKREMSNAKSPVLSHFGAAVAGLVSIRAYGAQNAFKQVSLERINRYVRSARVFYNLNRWVCIRMDVLGGLFSSGLAAYLVYGSRMNTSSDTGFSLNMAVAFSSMILWWVRVLNDFEVCGNSLERIQGYIDIEQEQEPTESGTPPAYWPSSGDIKIEKLSARYSPDGPTVLRDLSVEIKPGERVGVVGRTGSGKSTLTLSLLRCIPADGKVYYDGIATDTVNLDVLRRNITIIPQVPELLSGILRLNLDPFDEHDDATLNNALRAAGLFSLQNEDDENRLTLDSQIAAGGSNLSVGQRQILALARAIVRGSKLLILDEATSAIDYATDTIIQNSLRNELDKDVTLITVAHRLQTIMDSDKILVLDAGQLVEFDSPKNLLQKETGFFKSLVDGSGDKDALYAMVEVK